MFDFSWSCGSSRLTEVKRKVISECGEMRPMSCYQAIASSLNETVTSTHLANTTSFFLLPLFWFSFRCFYVIGFLLVVTAGREKWDLNLDSTSLSSYYTFFFLFGLRETGGGDNSDSDSSPNSCGLSVATLCAALGSVLSSSTGTIYAA